MADIYRSVKIALFSKAEPNYGPLYRMLVEQDNERGVMRYVLPLVVGLLLWGHSLVTSDGNIFYSIVLGWIVLWIAGEVAVYRRMRGLIRSGSLSSYGPPITPVEQTADDLQAGLGAMGAAWFGLYIVMVLPAIIYADFRAISFDLAFFLPFALIVPLFIVMARRQERDGKKTPRRPSLGFYLAVRSIVGHGVRRNWYRPVFHNFVALPLVCLFLISNGVNPAMMLWLVPAWVLVVLMIERVRTSQRFLLRRSPPAGEREQFLELLQEAIMGSDADMTKPAAGDGR